MSMPRVGSKHSNVLTPPATQRAMGTFCWLPPEHRRPVDEQLAGACALRAGEDVEQLVLALALEGHHPQHLSRGKVERHVLELGARCRVAGGQARLASRRPRAPACSGAVPPG